MAQAAGHDFDVDPGPQQGGGIGVTRVVEADPWQARTSDRPRELLGHVVRDERPTDVVGEDVAVPLPEARGAEGLLDLLTPSVLL
jgi:hypothetical protein